jgi:hypothetical protein
VEAADGDTAAYTVPPPCRVPARSQYVVLGISACGLRESWDGEGVAEESTAEEKSEWVEASTM